MEKKSSSYLRLQGMCTYFKEKFSLSVRMWVCVRIWVLVQVFGVGCFDGTCISRRRCHECFLFMCISSSLPSWGKRLLYRISFPITAFFCSAFWPLPPFFVDGWRGMLKNLLSHQPRPMVLTDPLICNL